MPARPLSAVPNIFASEGTGTLNNIPLLDQDFATLINQTNDSAIGYNNYGADTGTVNAYVVTLASAPSGYVPGMTLSMKVLNTNTGPSVINVNSVGSVSILMANGGALKGGELAAGTISQMVFNGTNFCLLDSAPVVSVNLGTFTTNQGVECLGASSVSVQGVPNANGINISFSHLGLAVPVMLYINPVSSFTIGIMASNPSGTALSVQGKGSGGTVYNLSTTGYLTGTNISVFLGSTLGNALIFGIF